MERECEVPIGRFTQFPFYVVAWVREKEMLLMVFSDHYLSDGMLGMVVLNDILENVERLANDDDPSATAELPLRPSLYSLLLDATPFSRYVGEWLVWLCGRQFFKRDVDKYQPLLPPRSNQHNFQIPIHLNPTDALFGEGSEENAPQILAACKRNGVTYTGALIAAVVLMHYHAAKKHGVAIDDTQFKMTIGFDMNMRQRVPEVVVTEENPVGYFVVSKTVERFSNEGIDLTSTRFWDVARTARGDIETMLEGGDCR